MRTIRTHKITRRNDGEADCYVFLVSGVKIDLLAEDGYTSTEDEYISTGDDYAENALISVGTIYHFSNEGPVISYGVNIQPCYSNGKVIYGGYPVDCTVLFLYEAVIDSLPGSQELAKSVAIEHAKLYFQDQLYGVDVGYANYGIIVGSDNRVKQTAPIAKWMIGKDLSEVSRWIHGKNGTINKIKENINMKNYKTNEVSMEKGNCDKCYKATDDPNSYYQQCGCCLSWDYLGECDYAPKSEDGEQAREGNM